jgi:biopolymer transport protein TolQ
VSWAIIAFKYGYIRKSLSESQDFLDYFFEVHNIDKVFAESENFRNGSLPRVFRAGYIEYRALHDKSSPVHLKERISLAVKREVNAESKRLSRLVPFLATVGNTAPFIGLFGTVWGIMNSFHNIGLMKSASLAAVAPGISEALIATAAGLVAAIPAVIAYNYFTQQISLLERDLDDFSPEFIAAYFNQH